MRTLLAATRQLLVPGAAVLILVAVGLGRDGPRPVESRPVEAPRFQPISGHLLAGSIDLTADNRHPVNDLETGEVLEVLLPASDYVSHAAASPWRDGRGRAHVAGMWRDMSGRDSETALRTVGLARYTLPDGEVLDRVELDLVAAGAPCWAPDGTPRIIVAGADGRLYRFAFEGDAEGAEGRRARPLRWRVASLAADDVRIADPSWPIDPRMAGTLIASVAVRGDGGERTWGPWRLWWLRLGPDGATIAAAGRLIGPAPSGTVVREERLACLSATPDDGLALAYLAREDGRPGLGLRVAPMAIDPRTGTPRVEEADSARLADDRALLAPAFSTDGRWLFSLPRVSVSSSRIERSPVAEATARRSAR